MRGRGHLLLIVLLASGCLAPAAQQAPTEPPREAPPIAWTEAQAETAPMDAAANEPASAPLVVRWSPDAPEAGDTLRVVIDAPVRWPEPRCLFLQLPAKELFVGQGGGESASLSATPMEDGYVCEREVLDGTAAIVLTVTRGEANLTRIHGPHVIDVPFVGHQKRVAFDEFALDVGDDGLPLARAVVPTELANVGMPDVGPLPGSDSTWAWFSLEVIPIGNALHMANWAYPDWTSPTEFGGPIDVPALIREAGGHMGETYPTEGYLLATVAHASNELAFAMSEGEVRGFGTCVEGACYVRDG